MSHASNEYMLSALTTGLGQMPLAALARAKRQCEEKASDILLNGKMLSAKIGGTCYCPMVAGLPHAAREQAISKGVNYSTQDLAYAYFETYGVKYFRPSITGFFAALHSATVGNIMFVLDGLIDTKLKGEYP